MLTPVTASGKAIQKALLLGLSLQTSFCFPPGGRDLGSPYCHAGKKPHVGIGDSNVMNSDVARRKPTPHADAISVIESSPPVQGQGLCQIGSEGNCCV